MPNRKRPASIPARGHRIDHEIVVDAYTPEERAIGWHRFLDDNLRFPFKASCVAAREILPLKKVEEVEVLGMAPADDCMKEMFVIVGFAVPRARRATRSTRCADAGQSHVRGDRGLALLGGDGLLIHSSDS